jgi:acetoacetyl-CoA synthetase
MGEHTGTNGTSASAKLLWRHGSPQSTAMHQFLQQVNQTHGLGLSDYPELHRWSVENTDAFWRIAWDYVGIRHTGEPPLVRSHNCLC